MMLLMQSVARALAPHRIRVNSITPGAIRTPLNRAAAWLASGEADHVHGQTLFLDGGMPLDPELTHGG